MNPLRYLRDGWRWLVNPYGFLDEAQRRHGLTFHVHLPVMGQVLMTGDPRLIAQIVQHPHLDAGKAVRALRPILGNRSLIMLDGDAYAARRRAVAPLFRGDGPRHYDALTIRTTREVLDRLPPGQTFSMYTVLRRITLKVMVAAMFGEEPGITTTAEGMVERFLDSSPNPLVLFFRMLHLKIGPWGRALRYRQELCDLIRRQMHQSPPSSLLGRLMAETPALAGEDVIEEVLALLLFGHDTAAATMAWAFAHIYQDVAVLDRLRSEEGGLDADPETPTFLRACILESMRLCPVVVHLARMATADLRLDEFAVRRGQQVIPCTYLAQHNAAVFSEPHKFRPERFLDGRRYEHAYFPFGFGNRTCVGQPFALRQMLLVLATAGQCPHLELAPGYQPSPVRHLVLIVPRGGPPMRHRK